MFSILLRSEDWTGLDVVSILLLAMYYFNNLALCTGALSSIRTYWLEIKAELLYIIIKYLYSYYNVLYIYTMH